jgi:formylmethanofuran--tetrahydromethanopterin N-formyltransferase
MHIKGVEIEDTFAEAFGMYAARAQVTALNERWAKTAALEATGFATSIIECGCEAGIERRVSGDESFDGRPGYNLLFLTMGKSGLEEQLLKRIGQSVMTSPTSACFNALESEEQVKIGGKLRYFGDGFQISKLYGNRRFWRVPVMDGEFVIEESFGIRKAVGGGNFLILGESVEKVLRAAERSVEAIGGLEGVILPFPGGVVRSGSKIESKYSFLPASTNTYYCPTLKAQVATQLPEQVNAVMEIVIDGLDIDVIKTAMREGILAACGEGVMKITAGNYGGNLGAYRIDLHSILEGDES